MNTNDTTLTPTAERALEALTAAQVPAPLARLAALTIDEAGVWGAPPRLESPAASDALEAIAEEEACGGSELRLLLPGVVRHLLIERGCRPEVATRVAVVLTVAGLL